MKALDEVIKAIEWCTELDQSGCGACPYSDNADNRCYEEDALHYLKEYKAKWEDLEQKNNHVCEMAKTICEEYDRLCNRLAEEYRNDPLTWDELNQMEGKPVWVEESAENGLWWTYWVIWQDDNAVLPKKDYSTKWKAYRKERE